MFSEGEMQFQRLPLNGKINDDKVRTSQKKCAKWC